MQAQIAIPHEQLAEFCQRHHIRKLALFGSALRDDFGPDSDVDVLVEFVDDRHIGLFALGAMQMELSTLLGREVDLKTEGFLRPHLRQQVKAKAQTIYEG